MTFRMSLIQIRRRMRRLRGASPAVAIPERSQQPTRAPKSTRVAACSSRVAGAGLRHDRLVLGRFERAARAHGRPLTTSILTTSVVFCDAGSVREAEEEVCARVGLEWRPLDQCPYVLIGDRARIADQGVAETTQVGIVAGGRRMFSP
jgi:hypothetical protein